MVSRVEAASKSATMLAVAIPRNVKRYAEESHLFKSRVSGFELRVLGLGYFAIPCRFGRVTKAAWGPGGWDITKS